LNIQQPFNESVVPQENKKERVLPVVLGETLLPYLLFQFKHSLSNEGNCEGLRAKMIPTMRRMTMITIMVIVATISSVTAFMPHQPLSHTATNIKSPLYMVLEKPRVKEIAKIEQLKEVTL
jgi:hypothetical protein